MENLYYTAKVYRDDFAIQHDVNKTVDIFEASAKSSLRL